MNFDKESKSGFFFFFGGGGGCLEEGHVLKPKQFARLEGGDGEECVSSVGIPYI